MKSILIVLLSIITVIASQNVPVREVGDTTDDYDFLEGVTNDANEEYVRFLGFLPNIISAIAEGIATIIKGE
uniref:Salivary secreted peptide n=1 Tax=Panagrellus redivivus TaxID=6233 RepID=A0A7E4UMK6_PANRE